jgi:hypothetical protein
MSLPSHAGDDATEASWLWRDVAAESCWRWHYRGDVDRDVMSLSSRCLLWHDVTYANVAPGLIRI